MPHKCFRCGSEDCLIAKSLKPPTYNQKQNKQLFFSERGNRASQKEYDNGDNNNDQNIYASMACMSDNEKCSSKNFGDSSQLTNWILDSGATCHMTPEATYLIPGSLEETNINIEVADGHHVTEKQKGQV